VASQLGGPQNEEVVMTITQNKAIVDTLTLRWEGDHWVVCPCEEGVCDQLTDQQYEALDFIVVGH
jgi:hypothetical protein